MEQALSDVKVVDLTQHVAGPYCTKLLADYGAEVIKVEPPGRGDVARAIGPFPGDIPHPEKSGLFLHLNTNKKSLTLNLQSQGGKRILKELVRDADILVESYSPRVAQSLGVTYEEMEKVNPGLTMVSITNFGQTGPYRDYKATDMLIYAAGGVLYVTGDGPDREPLKVAPYAALYLAGTSAAALTICAFYGARYNGLGQHVDVSLMEQIAGSIDRGATNLLSSAYSGGLFMQRAEPLRLTIMPINGIPCADGYIWTTSTLTMWPGFCRTIGHPEWIGDPKFANLFNQELTPEVDAALLEYTMQRGKAEIMEKAQTNGWAVTAVNTVAEVFEDRHLRERSFFVELEHPEAGRYTGIGPPFKMAETPWRAGLAPLLGEHNSEILVERLGYSPKDLALMRGQGII